MSIGVIVGICVAAVALVAIIVAIVVVVVMRRRSANYVNAEIDYRSME